MSLDVSLMIDGKEVYSANITHNLNTMAEKAGIYYVLWRPNEIGAIQAEDIIEPLTNGLSKLIEDPCFYEQFNASNGWGMYEHFVPFIAKYLKACKDYPNAIIEVCV